MEDISTVVVQAFHEGIRRLGETHTYDPVKGSLFDNEDFDIQMLAVVTVLVIGLGSLAAGAGIGGGGLFVPLFAFVLGVGAKAAVPMSKATILGGALGNMMSLAFARHPDATQNKPLIDYEASTFMQSGELLGVVFGVLLNLILPEIFIIVFLAVLLSFNAYKTSQKGVAKYKDESKKMALEAAKQQPVDPSGALEAGRSSEKSVATVSTSIDEASEGETPSTSVEETPSAPSDTSNEDKNASTDGSASLGTESPDKVSSPVPSLEANGDEGNSPQLRDTDLAIVPSEPIATPNDVQVTTGIYISHGHSLPSKELQMIFEEDAQQFPIWAWSMLAPMTMFTVFYAIVKKELVSTCGPAGYWLWYFTPVPVLGLFMYATARVLKKKHSRRVEAGYVFHCDGEDRPDYRDLKWTDETLRQFPMIALLAGVAAGLLGIGGGMVIGPLFIQLDMQPKVGSSSCAFMILWTAVSGVVQYAFAGKIGWQFILYGVVVGFVSGQIGQRGVDRMLKKSGRPSYVIFLLGGIVLVACIAMTCTGTYKFIKGIAEGDDLFVFDTYDLECHL